MLPRVIDATADILMESPRIARSATNPVHYLGKKHACLGNGSFFQQGAVAYREYV